jgi:pyruvate dehydrogenase E1 component
MDEPESTGAISLAAREKLDNLIFVINCNLQRLDGPVRGNGKVIQDLEGQFKGAGWNVIKVIWGSGWDELLAKDIDGALLRIMTETVDGEYQDYKSKNAADRRDGNQLDGRSDLVAGPRRPRSDQGLCGLQGCDRA